jgi:hypothetical protein
MAVVTLKYIRDKEQIKANLRYFTHRKGCEQEKITRAIFTNVGETDKQEFYRQVKDAGRGTVFFKFMISPDPKREDSSKDLDLPYITRRTIRKLEQAIGRRLYFVAAVHNADHTRSGMSTAPFLRRAGSPKSTSGCCRKSPGPSRHARLSFSGRPATSSAPVPAIKCSAASGERSSVAGEGEGLRRCSPAAATADLESSQAFPATARTARSATQASGKSANPGFGFSRQNGGGSEQRPLLHRDYVELPVRLPSADRRQASHRQVCPPSRMYAHLHSESRFSQKDAGHTHRPCAIQPRVLRAPDREAERAGQSRALGKTRVGKGLNITTNLLTWPFPVVVNDIKREFWEQTAGWRERGLNGRSFMFDPRGVGHKFDPFEGKTTDSDLRSAATILLHRPHEGQNAVFTERAITMLTQIFHAAKLENQRPLPFTYKILNEGLYGTATILKIIADKHNFYPHLATKFLDISYEQTDFDSKFLQDCYSTMTARINNILTKEMVRCFTGSDFTGKDIITSDPVSLYLCWPERDVDPRPPYRARLGLPDQRHG